MIFLQFPYCEPPQEPAMEAGTAVVWSDPSRTWIIIEVIVHWPLTSSIGRKMPWRKFRAVVLSQHQFGKPEENS